MRRQDAREGVEFGLNDFMPAVRGRVAPSPSRARGTRIGKQILAFLFVCIGVLLILLFSVSDHQSGPGVAVSSAYAYPVQRGDELKHEIRKRVDSLIQKIDDFVDEE